MFWPEQLSGRPDCCPAAWTLRLANSITFGALLGFLARPMTRDCYLQHLSQDAVFPPKGLRVTGAGAQDLLCYDFAVRTLRLYDIAFYNLSELLSLLYSLRDVGQVIIPGEYIGHSSTILALSYLNLRKITILGAYQVNDAFELLMSCKKLAYLSIQAPGFIEGNDGRVDTLFYSKALSNLRALSAAIGHVESQLTTLSLPFYSNLEYLHLQLCEDYSFVLQHANLHQLKISSDATQYVRCCDVIAPLLQQIEMRGSVYMAARQFAAFLRTSTRVVTVDANVYGRVVLEMQVPLLKRLGITAVRSENQSEDEMFVASALQYIAECCPQLVELRVVGIESAVVDKHMYGVLVNLKSLLKLHLQCRQSYSHRLYFHDIPDNYFLQSKCDIDTLQMALVAQNRLQELHLENLDIQNNFAYALFIMQHNYALKKISLISLKHISDSAIFLLLTSTEIRQDMKVGYRQLYSLYQSRESSVVLSDRCASATSQSKSFQSNFSVQFFDGVLEEQCMYQLEELRITHCPGISRQISQAILLSGFKLWNVVTDIYFSMQFIESLRRQRPWVRIESLGEDRQIKQTYLELKYRQKCSLFSEYV